MGDDGRHPGEGIPVIVSVNVFWPAKLDFWCGFVMQTNVWLLFCVF